MRRALGREPRRRRRPHCSRRFRGRLVRRRRKPATIRYWRLRDLGAGHSWHSAEWSWWGLRFFCWCDPATTQRHGQRLARQAPRQQPRRLQLQSRLPDGSRRRTRARWLRLAEPMPGQPHRPPAGHCRLHRRRQRFHQSWLGRRLALGARRHARPAQRRRNQTTNGCSFTSDSLHLGRLPTIKELQTIVDDSRIAPSPHRE